MATKRKPTWAEVANNVFMKLISTGQLPIVLLLLVFLFLVYRTPAENIAQVWVVLIQMIDAKRGLGYLIGGGATAGWAFHAKYQRRKFARELERIGEEKTTAQQLHFRKKLESSKTKLLQ